MAQNLTSHLAEIDALLSTHAQKKKAAPARTLNAEYKSMTMKRGTKKYTKPCKGPGICMNLLCEHIYAIPPPLDSAMERLLELMIKQSLADGYEISKPYGQGMMARNSWKLVPALAAVKADLDKRKNALKSSGRIRWPISNNIVDLKPEIRSGTNSYSTPMNTLDQIIDFLELEDNHLKLILAQKSLSPYYKDLMKNYPCKKSRDEAFAAYSAEARYRDAREKFFKENKKKGLKGGELTKAMRAWDLEHDGDPDFQVVGMRTPLNVQTAPVQTKPVPKARADGYVLPTVEDASDEDDVPKGPCEVCGQSLDGCECGSSGEEDEDEDADDEELDAVLNLVWGNASKSKTYQSKFVEQFSTLPLTSRYWESGKGTPRMTSKDIAFLRHPDIPRGEKEALFRHYREKNPSLNILDGETTKKKVDSLLKILEMYPERYESDLLTKEEQETLDEYEEQFDEDLLLNFNTYNTEIAQLSTSDVDFINDTKNSDTQKKFLYYLRLRTNSYLMLPPTNGETYRADFKYFLEHVKGNGRFTKSLDSNEGMGSHYDSETTEREDLEVELVSEFILNCDPNSLSWTAEDIHFLERPLPSGLTLFLQYQRFREAKYPTLPSDPETVVARFTILRMEMRKSGLLYGQANPFSQASDEERDLGFRSVEEYVPHLKSKIEGYSPEPNSASVSDPDVANSLFLEYVKLTRHLPESYTGKAEYSTFKRIFKKLFPLFPDDEDTMQRLFKHWTEDKKNAEEELKKSSLEKGKSSKGGPRLEMDDPELISKLIDEFSKHSQENRNPYEELCKTLRPEDESYLLDPSWDDADKELLFFRLYMSTHHPHLELPQDEETMRKLNNLVTEGMAKRRENTANFETTLRKKSKKRQAKYKLLTAEEYEKKTETQLVEEIKELESRYPNLSFGNLVPTDLDKAFLDNPDNSKQDKIDRWHQIWLDANAPVFHADHPTLKHYGELRNMLLCYGKDEYGTRERLARSTQRYGNLTEKQIVDKITELEKSWPSLSFDNLRMNPADDPVLRNLNSTNSEQAEVWRKRWKEINTPLIPNAEATMAHYSHLQRALTNKLADAKADEALKKELGKKDIDQLQEEIDELERKYPCLDILTVLTPEEQVLFVNTLTTGKKKNIRLKERYDERRRVYLSDNDPELKRYETLLAARFRKGLKAQGIDSSAISSQEIYESLAENKIYKALGTKQSTAMTPEKAASILKFDTAPVQKVTKGPVVRMDEAALPVAQSGKIVEMKPLHTFLPPAIDKQNGTMEDDEAVKVRRVHQVLPLLAGSKSLEVLQAEGLVTPQQAVDMECLGARFGQMGPRDKAAIMDISLAWTKRQKQAEGAEPDKAPTVKNQPVGAVLANRHEVMVTLPPSSLNKQPAETTEDVHAAAFLRDFGLASTDSEFPKSLEELQAKGLTSKEADDLMHFSNGLGQLTQEERDAAVNILLDAFERLRQAQSANAIRTPNPAPSEKKLSFLHQYNNKTPPPHPEAFHVFNKEMDAVEAQLQLELASGIFSPLDTAKFKEQADPDRIPIIDDEIGNIIKLNKTEEEIANIKGLLTESEANAILGLDATDAKKKLLFWERYLAKYPELPPNELRAAKAQMLKLRGNTTVVTALASKVPRTIEEIDKMRDMIQNLPDSPVATATTWMTVRDTLESDEARGAMDIRPRRDLLAELSKAEMEYDRKYGMNPTLTPEEIREHISERVLETVKKFSADEAVATDAYDPSKHLSKYKLKHFIENDIEPYHLIDDGTVMNDKELMHCYDTLKMICEDPTLQTEFLSRWKKDGQKVVKVFENEYFPVKDRLKALELHLDSLKKTPMSDEASHKVDVDKSKSESKGFLKKAGGVLRKIPTPKKISDNLFKNFVSKKIGEKLKKLEEESEAIEEAAIDVEDTLDAGVVRGLINPASPGYPEIVLEEDESDGSSSEDSSGEDSDEVSEADHVKALAHQATREKVVELYAGTTLHPIKAPITGIFEDVCAEEGDWRMAALLDASLKGYDKTLDPSIRPYFKHFLKLQAWVENGDLSNGPFKSDEICHIMVKCYINSYQTAVNMLSISRNDVKVAMRLYLHMTVGLEKYFASVGVAKPTQLMYEERIDAFAEYVWHRREIMMEPYMEEEEEEDE